MAGFWREEKKVQISSLFCSNIHKFLWWDIFVLHISLAILILWLGFIVLYNNLYVSFFDCAKNDLPLLPAGIVQKMHIRWFGPLRAYYLVIIWRALFVPSGLSILELMSFGKEMMPEIDSIR